jgi:hypothetical protein
LEYVIKQIIYHGNCDKLICCAAFVAYQPVWHVYLRFDNFWSGFLFKNINPEQYKKLFVAFFHIRHLEMESHFDFKMVSKDDVPNLTELLKIKATYLTILTSDKLDLTQR